jgi:hypothetical protein
MLCMVLTGCGARKGDVSGTVTYKGSALKGGRIVFENEEGGPGFSTTINEDGTYLIPNVLSGRYKVCVETETLKFGTTKSDSGGSGSTMKGPPGGMPPGVKGPGAGGYKAPGGAADVLKSAESGKIKTGPPKGENGMPEGAGYRDGFATMRENASRYVQIPAKYAKPETTDLTVEIRGTQVYDVKLEGN